MIHIHVSKQLIAKINKNDKAFALIPVAEKRPTKTNEYRFSLVTKIRLSYILLYSLESHNYLNILARKRSGKIQKEKKKHT